VQLVRIPIVQYTDMHGAKAKKRGEKKKKEK
jgi:hypothetical protein